MSSSAAHALHGDHSDAQGTGPRAKRIEPVARVQDYGASAKVINECLAQCGWEQTDLAAALVSSHTEAKRMMYEEHKRSPSIATLLGMCRCAANRPLVRAIARRLLQAAGGAVEPCQSAQAGVLRIMAEVGDVSRVVAESEADGVVTREERVSRVREIEEAIQALEALRAAELQALEVSRG